MTKLRVSWNIKKKKKTIEICHLSDPWKSLILISWKGTFEVLVYILTQTRCTNILTEKYVKEKRCLRLKHDLPELSVWWHETYLIQDPWSKTWMAKLRVGWNIKKRTNQICHLSDPWKHPIFISWKMKFEDSLHFEPDPVGVSGYRSSTLVSPSCGVRVLLKEHP